MSQPEGSFRNPLSFSTREDSQPVMIAVPVALLRYLFEGYGNVITLDPHDMRRLREHGERFEIFIERLQDPYQIRLSFRAREHS